MSNRYERIWNSLRLRGSPVCRYSVCSRTRRASFTLRSPRCRIFPARRILAASATPLRRFGFILITRRATLPGMTLQSQIQTLVSKFATDVERLVRNAAVEAVSSVLGASVGPAPAKPAARTAKRPGRPVARPVAKPAGKPRPATAKRVRRSPEQLQATADRIVAHVSANPGQGAEQIKAALGIASPGWGAPLALALDSKRIRRSGEKRASTYAPVGGAVPPIKRAAK